MNKAGYKRTVIIAFAGAALIALTLLLPEVWLRYLYNRTIGRFFRHSVESRLQSFGNEVRKRLQLACQPVKLVIIALKSEKLLELWGQDTNGKTFFIKSYPILAASGTAGPKLREGDRQVPEGFYAIESLHPNSHFYLALKIAYPSPEDMEIAIAEKRDTKQLGSNIMLHGRGGSMGCISVENQAVEEIFYLAGKLGKENISLLIMPFDFRKNPLPVVQKDWLRKRYQQLSSEVKKYEKTR